MLSLCVIFLVFLYVVKIFFPKEFVMVIDNERLVMIGNFIDNNIVLSYICTLITSFITYWLFMCACKRSLYLSWKEVAIILIFIVFIRVISIFDNNVATHISISSFFVIPLICKFDLKIATITYSIHGLSQVLSLSIRNLPLYFTNINSLIAICATLECYLWLGLMYIIFNYKTRKEE